MLQAVNRALTWTPVTVVSLIVIGMVLGPPAAEMVKHAAVTAIVSALPVKHDFRVAKLGVDGFDVVVSGTMVKRWSCEYQPPPRAVDSSGLHYLVESSSATRSSNWPISNAPYAFGPWRIVGAAGRKVSIYQEDECLGVGVFSWLGTIDTRNKQ